MAKLNFILALVECIIELAQSRSSPLSESITEASPTMDDDDEDEPAGSMFSLDHISFLSEGQRRMEQLVLYVRGLQLLASSIQLAKEELKAARLQSSNSVKTSEYSVGLCENDQSLNE